jgi:SAM-dependent methyltransferase
MMTQSLFDAEYWNNLYRQKQTAWDIGSSSTPLQELMSTVTNKNSSILVPGCGNAYEAESLLAMGFTNITLLDISPVLTAALREKFSDQQIAIVTGDFFSHEGQYDLILEQTFFCALHPTQRMAYVEQMSRLLKTGGKLVGVLFNRNFEGGPPFGGTKAEYEQLFSNHLNVKKMELCYNSIQPRSGTELFFIAEK